jgi:hypothetical protein
LDFGLWSVRVPEDPHTRKFGLWSFELHENVKCVFITAVPMTSMFAWGEGDSGGHVYEGRRTGTREEPGTLTQGAPVFPGSSRLGIEPKTPGWLVQDPTTRPI